MIAKKSRSPFSANEIFVKQTLTVNRQSNAGAARTSDLSFSFGFALLAFALRFEFRELLLG
jgi:hypothetical protein